MSCLNPLNDGNDEFEWLNHLCDLYLLTNSFPLSDLSLCFDDGDEFEYCAIVVLLLVVIDLSPLSELLYPLDDGDDELVFFNIDIAFICS